MGPKEFDAYMQHVLDTQFTPAEKSLKKSIIKKINKVQKKRGRKIFKEEFVNERKNPKREKLKKDFKTSLKFVKGVIRKIDTFMKSDYWGMVDGFVTDKRTGLVSIVKDMEKSMNQIIKMPVDESVNEALPNRVWMDLRKKYSTNELKRFFKKESVNEVVEPAGNMRKIQHIVKSKTAMKVGGTIIDMQSASLLMKLYSKVSDKDKEKMNKLNAKMLTTVIKRLWSRVNLKLPM